MQFFPIFLSLAGQRVVVCGAGHTAEAKLRLLLKTEARIDVYGSDPTLAISAWARDERLRLFAHPAGAEDIQGARLVYAAHDDETADRAVVEIARRAGVLANHVDALHGSDFITPAIVDRDPVIVAIGTEGAAPVLARDIKRRVEEMLPTSLGWLARIGRAFRDRAALLPAGRLRREFWSAFYFRDGPRALSEGGQTAAEGALAMRFDEFATAQADGRVDLVGTGPGDPELLTLKARRLLHEADVVIHDTLVPAAILELARREATIVETGKRGFGASWAQDDINALLVEHAHKGAHVVRLKSGDPAIFSRLDEEVCALDEAGVRWSIVPGITAASAAVASLGQSLTQRGRNSTVRLMTAHDTQGFAEADWRALARPDAVAAIYMGKRAARFVQGRLLMHGAKRAAPVSVVENASRPDQRIIGTDLAGLAEAVAELTGPAVILWGIAPRQAADTLKSLNREMA